MHGGILLSGAGDIWIAERVMVNCGFCVLVENSGAEVRVGGRDHTFGLYGRPEL